VTVIRRFVVCLSLLLATGCYTLQPVRGGVAPEAGTRVDVELNDAGRAALGPQIGPEVDRIDGTLLQQDSAGVMLAVKHIVGLNGSVQVWSNETVRVEPSHIRNLSRRRFSPGRTAVLGAVGVGGFALLVFSGLDPFGLGLEGDGSQKGDTLGESIIRVIRP
jgi:hypothetical protein